MKLKTANIAPSQTSGDMPITDIGISSDHTDQMMVLNILTNSLYEDKEEAILREYGCNGADANVEAGKADKPIHVKLPNNFDPTLVIRDFGYGMTQDQVQQVFCKLGRSTKRNSNEFTGMLGIGSKAGFAYGDQFMVTSFTNGRKCVYNAFRDRGIPKLAKMHEEDTMEHDGIEIKIPIRQDSIASVVTKAERVYRYFKVRPIITGAQIEWKSRDKEFEGKNWRYLGNKQESVAIMGNVGYRIDAESLGLGYQEYHNYYSIASTTNKPEALLLRLGLELDFNIGDLEIAANREGLQYDDQTKKALLARLQEVGDQIGQVLSDKISKAESLWDAKQNFYSMFEELDGINKNDLQRIVGKKIMWNGIAVGSSQMDFSVPSTLPSVTVAVNRFHRRGNKANGLVHYYKDTSTQAEVNNRLTLIINDLKAGASSPSRISGYFNTHPDCNLIVELRFQSDADKDAYWKARNLDKAPAVLESTIQPQKATTNGVLITASPSAHRNKHAAKVFKLKDRAIHSTVGSTWWEIEEIDLEDDEGVYVTLDAFRVRGHDSPTFWGQVDSARTAGLLDKDAPIYGFKIKLKDKVEANKNWQSFFTHTQKNFDDLCTPVFLQAMADYKAARGLATSIPVDILPKLPPKSEMAKHLEQIQKYLSPAESNLMQAVTDNELLWIKVPELPKPAFTDKELTKLESKMLKQYPLLDAMFESMGQYYVEKMITNRSSSIVDYVKLVGK